MKGLNKAMIIGRLGRDPEIRYTQGGQAMARFSMATDESWVDKNGEKQTRTEWHNIVAWGKVAEICNQYLKKGRLAYVEGRIQTRQWDDNSGAKRNTTEIVITEMSILESRASGGSSNGAPPPESPHPEAGQGPPSHHSEPTRFSDHPITDEKGEEDLPF